MTEPEIHSRRSIWEAAWLYYQQLYVQKFDLGSIRAARYAYERALYYCHLKPEEGWPNYGTKHRRTKARVRKNGSS